MIQITEETMDDLFSGSWKDWEDEVNINVWYWDDEVGFWILDEDKRHKEIEKRAFCISQSYERQNDQENWLRAEIEVDLALGKEKLNLS